jgi:hypothetical protein
VILNNYKNLLWATEQWSGSGSGSVSSDNSMFLVENIYLHRTDNTAYSNIKPYAIRTGSGTTSWFNPLKQQWYATVGSGTTPPTPLDYKIEQEIDNISGLTLTKASSMDENCNTVITCTITGMNNNNSAITISEVGIKIKQDDWNQKYLLIIREVLTEPLIIPAKKQFRIILEIVKNVTN